MEPTYIQILDSRGNPTIRGLWTHSAPPLSVAVPSGASTGSHEALEMRDGDEAYGGKGVLKAIDSATELSKELDWERADVQSADKRMMELDGTQNKSRYGANAILCVSMLQARLQAHQQSKPLHELLAQIASTQPRLPIPFSNIINGGRHAGNDLMLQEFMVVPKRADSFYEATRQVSETVQGLKSIIIERYGKSQTSVGDEGGFAPDINTPTEALDLLMEAMDRTGHDLGIAIDAAASEFRTERGYEYQRGSVISAEELTAKYLELIREYPIMSLEDPFHEDDFESFAKLRAAISDEGLSCQVVGDDLTVTNPDRIRRAVEQGAADCLLLKINQIGSVTESIQAARAAMDAGWNVMVSHRSGETEDSFIADLAVALGCGQIKLGAPVRGERTAKYNRLLQLESLYGLQLAPLQ